MAPVTDEMALSAAKVLLAYHEQQLANTVLNIIAEHHQDMIDKLKDEIDAIPRRTAAEKRARERYAETETE